MKKKNPTVWLSQTGSRNVTRKESTQEIYLKQEKFLKLRLTQVNNEVCRSAWSAMQAVYRCVVDVLRCWRCKPKRERCSCRKGETEWTHGASLYSPRAQKRPHFKFSKCKTFHNCCTQPQNKNVLDAKTSAHLYCIYIEPNVLSQLSVLSYPNTINITGQSGHRGSEVLEAQFDYYLRYNLCVISRVHLSSLCFMHLKRIIQITGQVNSSGFSGLTSHSLPGTVSNPAGVLYKEGRGGRVRLPQTHRKELH